MISITAVGVAVKKAAWFDPTFAGADKYRWLLCGMLAMAFFSVGVIDSVTERRQSELSDKMRVRVRFASAAFVILLGAAGAYMSSVFFLGLVAATAGVQVLFDMVHGAHDRRVRAGP